MAQASWAPDAPFALRFSLRLAGDDSSLHSGRDFYKPRIQNTCQTPRLFSRFKFSLSVDYDYSCFRSMQRDGQLSQLRLDLYLPERAQVQTTAPAVAHSNDHQ